MMIEEDRGILLRAIGAGLAAAVAGGVLWGLIVRWSEYEVGFVAWGIGFLAGIAILTATGGRRGVPLQALAVFFALLGILLGKYLAYAWVIQDVADEAAGIDVPLFSWEMIDAFRASLGDIFSWIDLLWVGLAVFTAWRALAPEQAEAAAEPEPGPAAEPTDRS